MTDIENTTNTLLLPAIESTSGCCRTTEDGAAICIVENGTTSACGCGSSNQEETAKLVASDNSHKNSSLRSKIQSGILFGVACLTSPCCTPLYVPLLLVLLAGTPVAVWLSAHLGWVYGGLTLVSVVSFVLGWRWLKQKAPSKQLAKTSDQLASATMLEAKHS